MAEAEAAIGARLVAMAKAHDILLKASVGRPPIWRPVIRAAIEQHCDPSGPHRLLVEGPALEIASATILPLSLLFNELCTNATKLYGALSKEGGVVTVSWTIDAAGKILTPALEVESGGPPAQAARVQKLRHARLIESGIPRQFGGTGLLSFPPSGALFRTHRARLARSSPPHRAAAAETV